MQGQKNGLRGAVPSTAGTGAEAGPWATMAGQAGGGAGRGRAPDGKRFTIRFQRDEFHCGAADKWLAFSNRKARVQGDVARAGGF